MNTQLIAFLLCLPLFAACRQLPDKATVNEEIATASDSKLIAQAEDAPQSPAAAEANPLKKSVAEPPAKSIKPEIPVVEKVKASGVEDVPGAAPEAVEAFDHGAWDQLLRKYVSAEGKVNYKGFLVDKKVLESYLETLALRAPQAEWSRREQMAWWINAYNAFTIKLILDRYPVASITDLHGGKPWDLKWIEIGGAKYSLNQIENDILRPKYKDARIHFALNCAARSCPPLLHRAWTADNLEPMLEKQTRSFINNARFNHVEPERARVSKIFDWYAADFGDLKAFLNRYSTVQIAPGAQVVFEEYDWGLNE